MSRNAKTRFEQNCRDVRLTGDNGRAHTEEIHPAAEHAVDNRTDSRRLDRLYNIARPKMDGQKLSVTVPLLGEFKFDVNDLDKVYRYIQEA